MFYGFAGWLLHVPFIFKMAHNKYPCGGRLIWWKTLHWVEPKSNRAHLEKTVQLVEVLDPCHLQIFPRSFMKSTTSRMWLNDHPPKVDYDMVSPADLVPPYDQSRLGCNDWPSVQPKYLVENPARDIEAAFKGNRQVMAASGGSGAPGHRRHIRTFPLKAKPVGLIILLSNCHSLSKSPIYLIKEEPVFYNQDIWSSGSSSVYFAVPIQLF